MNARTAPLKIAVLISGTGRSLQNLIKHTQRGTLNAKIVTVISSNPHAKGLTYADAAGIPHHTVAKSSFKDPVQHSESLFSICRDADAEMVVMAGYIQHVRIPTDFASRVINIHPSLIPEFCGKGFYGQRVHEAVIRARVTVTGCTVHFVDNQYDHGPVILQRSIPVLPQDTPTLLGQRVFAEECEALPEAIRMIADGRVACADGQLIRGSATQGSHPI